MFERFHPDIATDLAVNVDIQPFSKMLAVSKNWHRLFNDKNIWKTKIANDFNIEPKLLNQYEPAQEEARATFYKTLYQRLYRLKQNYFKISPELKKHLENSHLILIACLDNVSLLSSIPYEDEQDACKLALYAGCKNIGYYFFKQFQVNQHPEGFLSLLTETGFLDLLKELIEPGNSFGLKPDGRLLGTAIAAGQFNIINYLCDTKEFGFELTDRIFVAAMYSATLRGDLGLVHDLVENKNMQANDDKLSNAAQSGNLELFRYLLKKFPALKPSNSTLDSAKKAQCTDVVAFLVNHKNELGLTFDHTDLHFAANKGDLKLVKDLMRISRRPADQETLSQAVSSGNLELVHYLVELGLKPTKEMLNSAATLGYSQVVNYFLNENKFGLQHHDIDPEALLNATDKDSLAGVMYLLDPKNNFNFKANHETLRFAGLSVLRYLLNPANGFDLKPNDELLDFAIEYHSFKKLYYLLDPKNNFNFNINLETAKQLLVNWNALYETIEEKNELSNLLRSEIATKIALKNLKANHFNVAEDLFQKSRAICISHCTRIMNHALSESNPYELDNAAMERLANIRNNIELLEEPKNKRARLI